MRSQTLARQTAVRKRRPPEDPASSRLVDRAYQTIRDLITTGGLPPGSRVGERELARRLAMSPTPVRAALHRLGQQGYFDSIGAGRSTRIAVAPLRRADMEELYFLIGDLEGWAAFRAAQAPRAERLAITGRLAAINRELATMVTGPSDDPVRNHELDAEWHWVIVTAGGGPRLTGLLRSLKPQADRYDRLYVAHLGREVALSVAEHQAVERAIRRGDSDAARAAMMRNWTISAIRLGAVIDARGEMGAW